MKAIVLDNQCNRITVFNDLEAAKYFRTRMQRQYKEWFGVLWGSGGKYHDMSWVGKSKKYNSKGDRYFI